MNKNKLVCLFVFFAFLISSCNNSKSNQNTKEKQSIPINSPVSSGQQNSDINFLLSQALGTENLINTCFANSVHKLIWAYLNELNDKSLAPQYNNFQDLFYKFMSDLDKKNLLLTANSSLLFEENKKDPFFAKQLNKIFDNLITELIFRGGNGTLSGFSFRQDQMDAEEYFTKLIELLELNKVLSAFNIASQIELNNGTKLPVQAESTKQGGVPDDIIYFPLNIYPGIGNFAELFTSNLTTEIEDFEVAGVLQKVTKTTYLTLKDMNKVPRKIVLGLKRFSQDLMGNLSKNTEKISIANKLNIVFYSMDLKQTKNVAYNATGVVVHYGSSLKGGHYVAYLKMPDKKWYKHNDTHVSIVETPAEQLEMQKDIENNGYLFLFDSAS